MGLTREQMLAEMGITPLWRLREQEEMAGITAADKGGETAVERAVPPAVPEAAEPAALQPPPPGPAAPAADRAGAIAAMDWPVLEASVAACRACSLCEHRKQAVLGVGDRRPNWLFIGEGPGAEEDAQGEPFVGQAGKLLDAMLAAIDLQRGQGVYIGNAVKCRPPGNRTPEAEEMAACWPYLERQIALLQPRIIVLLGRAAVTAVLKNDRPLSSLRGKRFDYGDIPLVVTYHPAYLLRNLPEKAKAWEDLLFARRLLREAKAGTELPFA